MAIALHPEMPPIRVDEHGVLRVGKTRVLLELVLISFKNGCSPETIAQQYDTLTLADVYAVIAYYLRNREEMEAYLAEADRQADELQRRIEAEQGDMSAIRERLLARRIEASA